MGVVDMRDSRQSEGVPASPSGLSFDYADEVDMRSDRGAGFIEGYAAACEDIRRELTGEGGSGKSYDPMRVCLDRDDMDSYAFDMKDGGRHHPLSDYSDLQEVADVLLRETLAWIHEADEETMQE